MKLIEVYQIANGLAPKALSDEYCAAFGAYDNSGLLIEACQEVKGILFTLDLTNRAIDEAEKAGCNLIITHHPVIYGKISDIKQSDCKLLGGKLIRCIQKGISVISMHLNLDTANGGIDESMALGLGQTQDAVLMHPLSAGGYGRVYPVAGITLAKLVQRVEDTFSAKRVIYYGDKEREINKIASFCGAGADEESIAFAKREGADAVISADFKHHLLITAVELGMAVIIMTHYASENYGFRKYYEKIRRQVEIPCVYHTDEDLL